MHRGNDVNAHALEDTQRTLLAQEAAHWMVLQHAGELDESHLRALKLWRDRSPDHERAWQAAQELRLLLAQVPQDVGLKTLSAAGRTRRQAVRGVVTATLATPLAWWMWHTFGREWAAEYRTAVGERRTETLADGSRIWLNTGSAVNVRFTATERALELVAGEVLVETAHSALPLPPLEVVVNAGRVRALGTRFLVRELRDARWRVAVLQHAVRIRPARSDASQAVELHAGMQTDFDAHRTGGTRAADDNAAAWRDGVLVARDMRLVDLTAEIARYRRGFLGCAPEVANLRISGVFQLDDTDRTLRALAESLSLAIRERTRYWVTLTAKSQGT
ncbi:MULTISPECIES: FecR domain-containing protein [Variovorax]|uniref:FecR domain-containing protein n=1 Tax=Variovorax TaxID=34072 RepID=UPI00339617DB